METKNVRILICIDWFRPGFKAGGIIRSCSNMVKALSNKYHFYIFTRNIDFGDTVPYQNIAFDEWVDFAPKVKIFYGSSSSLRFAHIKSLIKSISPDIIYLNSMYSLPFTLYPMYVGLAAGIKVILAPRGMLKPSALAYKSLKKHVFLRMFRLLKFHARVTFHATDHEEVHEIQKAFGPLTSICRVSDFPGEILQFRAPVFKEVGALKLIFLGRIHPIKNLNFLLETLAESKSKISLNIIGKIEDINYWHKCEQAISALPPNCKVSYLGELDYNSVRLELQHADLLVHPTKGENFGHVVFEMLSAGRPVIVSDRTPWKRLEEYCAGWVISLSDKHKYIDTLEAVALMSHDEFLKLCHSAYQYAHHWLDGNKIVDEYNTLFQSYDS